MMDPGSDLALVWDPAAGRGDWAVAGPVLQTGGDLASAVLISLFTDALASADDALPDQSEDPRGWWGDVAVGSKLWLLTRAKQTDATLGAARDAIVEALQWLVDDGVVETVEVTTEWTRPKMLGARVVLRRGGETLHDTRYDWAWAGVG